MTEKPTEKTKLTSIDHEIRIDIPVSTKVDEKIAVCDKTRFPSQKCLDEFYTQINKNAHVENEEDFRNP